MQSIEKQMEDNLQDKQKKMFVEENKTTGQLDDLFVVFGQIFSPKN